VERESWERKENTIQMSTAAERAVFDRKYRRERIQNFIYLKKNEGRIVEEKKDRLGGERAR